MNVRKYRDEFSGFDLLLLFFLVLCDCLRWSDTHLCRLEGLQTVPHGSLEDLLHFIFILVDIKMAAAVPVSMLLTWKQGRRCHFDAQGEPQRAVF